MLSFRNRLLILLVGLVVGAQIVTLFTALASTYTAERKRAAEQLELGAQNASDRLAQRQRELRNAASVLTADWGLREAMALNDAEGLSTVLYNHVARIGADLAVALDLDGEVMARHLQSPMADAEILDALQRMELSGSQQEATFLRTGSGIYQVTVVPVMAPDEIGQVVLGFSMDQALAEDLSVLVNGEVAFLAAESGGFRIVAGTPELAGDASDALLPALRNSPVSVNVRDREYLATATHMSPFDASLDVALLVPMEKVLAPFRRLAWILGLIFGISLLLAALAGIYLGRSAARPVLRLAESAERIAAGDYTQHVQSTGGRELANLANAFNSMQSEIAEREGRLRHLALHDVATGLPNRACVLEWLDARLRDDQLRMAVVQCTLTNLQEISASLGFRIAGELVAHVAAQLRAAVTAEACVARLDGAEFVAVQPLGADEELAGFTARMQTACAVPLSTAGIVLRAAVVLGVADVPRHAGTADESLRCARAAVEAALAGRQAVGQFVQASDEAQRRRLTLGADLPRALQDGELHMLYQPKVRLADGRVGGVEALVRWTHPSLGAVSPVEFVPIAERTGTSAQLTRWVLDTTLGQLSAWHRDGIRIEASVNLSAADLLDTVLINDIMAALQRAGLPPGSLTLEITESVLLHDADAVRRNMETLRLAGVRFSIDDFGTGYSSLSQLRELAADELKIDQSFVRGSSASSSAHVAMLRAIVEMAHGLGLKTVAEGVEQEEHRRLVADLGCEYAQGYLFSRPVSAEALAPMLEASRGEPDAARTESLRVLELRRQEG